MTTATTATPPPLQTLATPVPVGSVPGPILVDPSAGKVYVTNYDSHNVSVISTDSHTIVATLQTGENPVGLLADPQDGLIFVDNSYYLGKTGSCESPCPVNGTITIYSTTSNTQVATVQVGKDPDAMAFVPATDELFVAQGYSDNISVISVSQERVTQTLHFPALELAYDPSDGMVFATGGFNGIVSVIDSQTNSVFANVTVAGFPEWMVTDPWTGDVYVADTNSNSVSVISASTYRVFANISIPGQPGLLTVDPTNGDVLVASNEFSNARQHFNGNLTVLSDASNPSASSFPIDADYFGMVGDNATGAIYLLTPGNLTVFNASTVAPVYTDPVNESASQMAPDPAGGALYIVSPVYLIGAPGFVDIYAAPSPTLLLSPSSSGSVGGSLELPVLFVAAGVAVSAGCLAWYLRRSRRTVRRP